MSLSSVIVPRALALAVTSASLAPVRVTVKVSFPSTLLSSMRGTLITPLVPTKGTLPLLVET